MTIRTEATTESGNTAEDLHGVLSVRVVERTAAAPDICRLELAAVDGAALPSFSAGAHVDVTIRPGLVRQYSLCNAPHERQRYVIAVLKEPRSRGGSLAIHEDVQAGSVLSISRPRNHFELDESAPSSLLFAGGIGITPLMSMAARLHGIGRPFELHHCVRSAPRAAFRDELLAGDFAASVVHHHDDGPDAQRLKPKRVLRQADPEAHIYVCGPDGFMDFVIGTAADMGWPERQIHREYFAASADRSTSSGTVTDTAFDVVLARQDGRRIHVPADKSIVQALALAGVALPVSCEAGICGTCRTGVLDGLVDHRDRILSAEERASGTLMTPCCSRARSDLLVLDL